MKGFPGAAAGIAAGTVIDDKFRIEAILGTGGMGVVAKAVNLRLGTPVALKFLLPQALADRTVVERFMREGRAAARLTSDHVARVLDVGSLSDGQPYMVMEFLDGETVGAALERRGTFPIYEACSIMVEACEGLAEAHGLGIVHRDLKPANLFLAKRPNKTIVKVLDFGISKVQGDELGEKELTKTSSFLGTPHYMAPEQFAASRAVDPRADIWSCGVCLFRMLSGQFPFDADGVIHLGVKILQGEPTDLMSVLPGAPPALAAIVRRCLSRDPNARFAGASALAEALRPFTQPGTAPTPIVHDISSDATEAMTPMQAHDLLRAPTPMRPPSPSRMPMHEPTPLMPASGFVVFPPPRTSERIVEPSTSGGFGRTHASGLPPAPPSRSMGVLVGAGAGLLVLLAIIGVRVLGTSSAPPSVASETTPSASASIAAPIPTPIASAAVAPVESVAPVTSVAAAPAETVTTNKKRPQPPPIKRPVSPPTTPTTAPTPKPAIPDER